MDASSSTAFPRGVERGRALFGRWRTPLGIALGTKAAFFGLAWASYLTRTDEPLGSLLGFFERWNQWDSPRYLQIARDGYVSSGEDAKNIVFYPLYPALVAATKWVVGHEVIAALVVTTLSSLALAVAFWELVRRDHSDEVATKAVLALFCFPTGYFLHLYYTEATYLLVAVLFFLAYRARDDASRPGAMAVTGVLAGLARVNGLSLGMAVGAEALWRRRRFPVGLAAAAPAAGFFLYLVANRVVQGRFGAYEHWLSSYWHKSFSLPWVGVRQLLQPYETTTQALQLTHAVTEPVAWFLGLVLLLAGLRRQPLSWSLYSAINLALFVSTTFVMSTPRYVLALFPQYVVLARLVEGRPVLGWWLLLVGFGLQLVFGTHFMFGQWAF